MKIKIRSKRKLSILLVVLMVCFTGTICGFSIISNITKDTNTIAYAASLNQPTVKVTASGFDGLKISWSKVPGAKKYEIYRSPSKSDPYEKISSTTKTSYTDKKINQNKTYYYKVKAVNGNSKSDFSLHKSGKINPAIKLEVIPEYKGTAAVTVNNNMPRFSDWMKKTISTEAYSRLDILGRCRMAYACIGKDLMPTEERGSIGMIRPAGWHTVRYDDLVDGKYLYNRCHLIGYQLTGENANEKNLITGTRYLNMDGMLPYENKVADYIKATGNHVLYRVTPIYSGDDLLCRGVQMEAYSVEDHGKGICFNVFAYNVQPGININYATGDSERIGERVAEPTATPTETSYVLNKNTKKFHLPSCSSVLNIKPKNREDSAENRATIIERGYEPCKRCNP